MKTSGIFHSSTGGYIIISSNGEKTSYDINLNKIDNNLSWDVGKKVAKSNKDYSKLLSYSTSKEFLVENLTKVDTIGTFDVMLDKTTFDMVVKIDDEYLPITKELIEKLKAQTSRHEKLKLDLKSSSVNNSISFGSRVLLYWPTGTGKTFDFLQKTAQLIHDKSLSPENIEIVTISDWLEDVDFISHIIHWNPIRQVETRVVNLMRKASKGEKVAILLDELNRWNKSFLNQILKLLDAVDGEFYHFNNFVADEIIKVPIKNVLFYATMNLGSKYVGTNALDEALLDRFNIVNFKGYDKEVEKEITTKAFWIHSDKVTSIIEYIRQLSEDGSIRCPISTRGIKIWAEAFINSNKSDDAILETFENTLLYRIVSVDDIWVPSEEEITLIKDKLASEFKIKTTEETTSDETPTTEMPF